jgi:aminoglycoside phosphotransferase (APT) family kinase protein
VSVDTFEPTVELVEMLLADQFPDLEEAPIRPAGGGWDNVLFRLGADLAVRMPRRAESAPLVLSEQRWLPGLAAALPLPIAAPLRCGRPGRGYPWHWSVVPWFEGTDAARLPPTDTRSTARVLGGFLGALHRPAPADAPHNPYRGVPLADRDAVTRARLAAFRADGTLAGPVIDTLERLWIDALAVPRWDRPPSWLHGDPHPANLIVRNGEVVGVIDFGDICAGDPATDLIAAHYLLPSDDHDTFRTAHGSIDDHTWGRSVGWAVAHTAAMLSGPSDPPLIASARRAVAALTTPA